MPTPRTEVTASNLGEGIYAMGGFDSDGRITNIAEMFNVIADSWNRDIA